jgi:hypothetical protein
MTEERSGSGSSVAMIIVAVLGGLALVVCCGGVALVGVGMLFYRAARAEQEVMRAQDQADRARMEFNEANKAIEEANAKLRQEMEGLKLPDPLSLPLPPNSVPPAGTPPAEPEK